MTTKTHVLILLTGIMLSACRGDPYQGLYEGIKAQNESRKTPQERAITPTPSYDAYKKEREKNNATAAP
jgi:hypothetical protein